MLALVASLCGMVMLGAMAYLPPLLGRDSGVVAVQPGLLTVAPGAGGLVTLGAGRAVRLDAGGMIVTHDDDILFQTVRGGSPLTALRGEVGGAGSDRDEDLDLTASNLSVERLSITPGSARWTGVLVEGRDRFPVTLTVRYAGSTIDLAVEVEGADGVIVHSSQELGTVGIAPGLPDRRLQRKAWWVSSGAGAEQPVYLTARATAVAIGPAESDRAVDLRRLGHTDIHVWSSHASLGISSRVDERYRP